MICGRSTPIVTGLNENLGSHFGFVSLEGGKTEKALKEYHKTEHQT